MRYPVLLAALTLSTLPAAARDGADGDWACKTLIGITPVAYLTLSGSEYGLTRPDGSRAKGTVTYTDSPIIGFTVDGGPLLDEFDAAEAIMMGDDRMMFDAKSGGIALMCEPGKPEKPGKN